MHSRSALWVLGVARLISRPATTWAMIGPGRNSKSCDFWLKIDSPPDVRWQQVRRELDAAEGAADVPAQRLGQHRLAHPGHVLDEDVTLGQEGDEGQPHLGVLADDDAPDVPIVRSAGSWTFTGGSW